MRWIRFCISIWKVPRLSGLLVRIFPNSPSQYATVSISFLSISSAIFFFIPFHQANSFNSSFNSFHPLSGILNSLPGSAAGIFPRLSRWVLNPFPDEAGRRSRPANIKNFSGFNLNRLIENPISSLIGFQSTGKFDQIQAENSAQIKRTQKFSIDSCFLRA